MNKKYIAIGGAVVAVLLIATQIKSITRSDSDASGGIPVAVMTTTPSTGEAPLTVNFDGTQSFDPDGIAPFTGYAWDFGDGTKLGDVSVSGTAPATTSHTYNTAGTYVAKLTVWNYMDNLLATSTPAIANIVVSSNTTNKIPVAVMTVSPSSGNAPLTVTFNGTGSYDTDGTIAKYSWNFGDGQTGIGATVSHTYPVNPYVSVYSAKLTVTDNIGLVGTSTPKSISVNSTGTNQSPVAKMTATPSTGVAPLTVAFSGSQSTDSDGTIASYAWDFGDGSAGSGVSASHVYATAGTFISKLTVTDNGGKTSSTTTNIIVTGTSTTITAPSNLTATSSNKVVTLKWLDKSTNEEGFYVERALSTTNPVYQKVGTVTANSTQFTQTVTAATYIYRVQAFNLTTGKVSAYSNAYKIRVK